MWWVAHRLGCIVGADIDLVMARREAERAMRDEVKVTRTVIGVINESTGNPSTTTTSIYQGKGRLKHPRASAKDIEAGAQLLAISALEVQVPVSTAGFTSGDIVEITKSPDRPAQIGRKFKILAPFDGTQTTSLRYRIEATDERV